MIFLCTLLAVVSSLNSHELNKRQVIDASVQSDSLSEQEHQVINSIHELALQISSAYWEKGSTENVVLSPVSIASLLSLLMLGSRGDSYLELKRGLDYPNDLVDESIHQIYQKLLTSLEETSNGIEISMSTRIFLQEGLSVLSRFTDIAKTSYNSRVRSLDFKGSPVRSQDIINKWVERSTNGKIQNLISQPFSPDTKFVATNVIYFNGEWENPFPKRLTSEGIFQTGTKNITVPMMVTIITVPFIRGDQIGFDIISLPYKGNRYSMYILTPKGIPGILALQRMEYHLNSNILDQLISKMEPKRVGVKMPRMKLSQKLYLKDDLRSFGINQIFDPTKADFGRLTTETGIFVSDIVHEAVLEVSETGTVAAAASSATFDRIGGNEIFVLDRPSLLFIRDNDNGLILFWARVMEPEPLHN
ncbi:UNVERIFIED_CONTAM: hypothetical protein RMT77_004716 [Armadillidium vulgare]